MNLLVSANRLYTLNLSCIKFTVSDQDNFYSILVHTHRMSIPLKINTGGCLTIEIGYYAN